MSNVEYIDTQTRLTEAAGLLEGLDLNTFRDRIRMAETMGPLLDSVLYKKAIVKLQLIDELASAAIRVQGAFHNLKTEVATELHALTSKP